MSPQDQPKLAPRTVVRASLLLALGGALLFLALPVSAQAEQVTICHATGSESNPFVAVTAAKAGIVSGHYGSDHQDGEDIIPPFTYQEVEYSQNWDAEGQAIFEDECGLEDDPTTTTSDTETSTEVPFFGAPAVMGLGIAGAIGGALVMLRRRI